MMELLSESLKNGDYWIFAALISIYIIINLPKIIDFYKENRKTKSDLLNNLLSSQNISNELKLHLKEEVNIEYFRLAHGVTLSSPMLNATFILKKRTGQTISFRHILRTIRILPDISDISLSSYRVKLSLPEKMHKAYSLVVGILSAIFGLLLFLLFLYTISFDVNFDSLLIGIAFMLLGGYMFNDGASLFSVYHVNNALAEYEDRENKESL